MAPLARALYCGAFSRKDKKGGGYDPRLPSFPFSFLVSNRGEALKQNDSFEHTSEDEPEVQNETDRYIAVPAQALGYKLGQLEILRLREKAQKELGGQYDVRTFHDEILNGGALPLDVLDERWEIGLGRRSRWQRGKVIGNRQSTKTLEQFQGPSCLSSRLTA